MKKISLIILLFSLIIGCDKAEQLIEPYHYSIVPRATNFQIEKFDSTNGKFKVFLRWEFADTTNLKNFELHRSTKNPDNFRIVPPAQRNLFFVDSTFSSFTDTLTLYYKVFSTGYKTDPTTKVQTSFLGPESDIKSITLKKKK